jgi:tetratricopeptide (TPR) repeat protein
MSKQKNQRLSLFLFVLISIFTTYNRIIYAQTPLEKIDSLEKIISKKQVNDTTWINAIISLEKLYIDTRNQKKGTHLDMLLKKAKKANYLKGISQALRLRAYQYADEGDYKKALNIALEKLAYDEKNNTLAEVIDAYNLLVYVNARSNIIPKALEYALLAKKGIDDLPETHPKWYDLFGSVYSGLGNMYIINQEYNKTSEIKALDIYAAVIKNAKKAIELNRMPKEKALYLEGSAYNNMAFLYYRSEKYQLSAEYAQKALAMSEQHNVPLLLPPVLNILVLSYTNIGDFKNAERYLAMMGEFDKNKKLKQEELLGYYKVGRELYLKQNKFELAYQYQDKYYSLKDSIQGTDVQNKLNELSTKYETEKKEAQIKTLERERTLKNYLIAAIFIFLIGSAVAIWNKYKSIQLEKALMSQTAILQQEQAEKLQLEMDTKHRELASSTLYLEQRNGFLDTLKTQIKSGIEPKKLLTEIDRNMNLEDDWQNFKIHFEQVHHSFFEKLLDLEPNLTDLEQKQCAYLKLNLSPKQVSNLLNVTPHAVSVSRTRIKKKLGIDENISLNDFLTKL